MKQHAPRWIDAQPGEELGISQWQFHHLTQGLNGVAHTANIIIVDRTASIARLFKLGAKLNFGVLVDMYNTLWARCVHRETNLCEGVGRRAQHLAHIRGHVLNRLLAGGGDQISGYKRLSKEVALESLRWPLEAHFSLRRSKHDPGRRARLGHFDIDMLA